MTLDYFYGQSGELFSYFRIPKALFQDSRFRQLSTDARTLYGILLDRMSLSVKNGWMDKQERAMFRKKNGQTNKIHLSILFGGASGSRTLAPVSRPIAFRVRPLTTT